MAKLRTGISCVLLLTSFKLYAQQFYGRVLDRETNAPIPFAEIYFPELHTGVYSDENGAFVINDLPHTKLEIQISFLGYQTLQETIDLKTAQKKDFFLMKSLIRLEEVIISVPQGRLQGETS